MFRNPDRAIAAFAVIVGCFISQNKASAQPESVGVESSFTGFRVTYSHTVESGASFVETGIKVLTPEVFLGRRELPGISASLSWNHVIKESVSVNGNSISVFAGPGAVVGYGADFRGENGMFFGLVGRLGAKCAFDRNIMISASISPVIGSHVVFHREYMTMRPYINGFVYALVPEIGVGVMLDGKGRIERHDDSYGELPRVTFGAEWGYVASLFTGHHYNFYSPDGYRVDDKGSGLGYRSNADVYLHVGCNLTPKWNLSLYFGCTALADFHAAVPVSLRATRYFGENHMADRWFTFVGVGSGICIKQNPREIICGKIGGGYRVSLSRNAKIDMLLAMRFIHTHPDVIYYGELIEKQWIRQNNGYVCSASLGISLTL